LDSLSNNTVSNLSVPLKYACDTLFTTPTVDFSRQTLLLIEGWTPNQIYSLRFAFIKDCNENYVIKINGGTGPQPAVSTFYYMVLVNKIIPKGKIKLIINNKPQ
jgi:hypothetical protein